MSLAIGESGSIAAVLRAAARRIDPSEARLLLAHALSVPRSDLVTRSDRVLPEADRSRFAGLVARRAAGEPIAQIVGEREFYGLALRVTSDVLIPRPETELLVELALERIPGGESTGALELGTGSGAVAIALAHERPRLRLVATDVSQEALAVAADNARCHGAAIEFLRSDWFAALGARRFQLIVANPPYVASGDPHLLLGDVRFEPRLALMGGRDGLDCIRRIASEASAYLEPAGWLLLEHGYDQAPACCELLRATEYEQVRDFPDLSGRPRVCAGRKAG